MIELSKPIPLTFFSRYVGVYKSKFHRDICTECCRLSSNPQHFTFPTGNLPFNIHKNHTALFPSIFRQNRILPMDVQRAIRTRANEIPIAIGRSLLKEVSFFLSFVIFVIFFQLAINETKSVRVHQYGEFTRILPSKLPTPPSTGTGRSKPRLDVGFEDFLLFCSLILVF